MAEKICLTATQLSKVKEYQRDFEERFNKKLSINWPEMKGVIVYDIRALGNKKECYKDICLEELLQTCVNKYGASLDKLKDRTFRIDIGDNIAEKRAIQEYCKIVVINNLNRKDAAKLINRDRSVLYHFAKYERKV